MDIDKPISLNFDETEKLVRLAQESGKVAMVGFNRRFSPMFKKLKEYGKADIIIMQKTGFVFQIILEGLLLKILYML